MWLLVLNVAKCSLFVINCVLQREHGYRRSSSSYVFAKTCRRHLFFWLKPSVNQINGSGPRWHLIFSDSASHCREAHRMYSEDVGGGQHASLAFLWCPRPLWRCPPAPFTFEFLSRPNRSVVKYTLKSYEFMNFTQEYLSPSPYHQGESFPAQRQSCNL